MLIENGITFQTDVAQKMARFLVTQAFNSLFLNQPVAAFQRIFKTLQLFTQLQTAVLLQKISRSDDVTGAGARVAMSADERVHQFLVRSVQKQRSHGFDRAKPHSRRTTARKKAK